MLVEEALLFVPGLMKKLQRGMTKGGRTGRSEEELNKSGPIEWGGFVWPLRQVVHPSSSSFFSSSSSCSSFSCFPSLPATHISGPTAATNCHGKPLLSSDVCLTWAGGFWGSERALMHLQKNLHQQQVSFKLSHIFANLPLLCFFMSNIDLVPLGWSTILRALRWAEQSFVRCWSIPQSINQSICISGFYKDIVDRLYG